MFRKKKVLVCGSEGNLMQHVIPKLLNNGYDVYGVDNLFRHGVKRNKKNEYHFFKTDLVDRRAVNKLFDNISPDYVIQAAARIYGIGGFNEYCADILGEDITLHNNVLRACANQGIERFVYISSSMVYETKQSESKETDADNIVAPKTEYGLSKLTCERLTIAYYKQYGVPYTIWRPFNIVAPDEEGEWEQGRSHVFADFIENILVDKLNPLPIIGDGLQVRCFTHVDDVSTAIADFSFNHNIAENQIYNLGNTEPYTMKLLAYLIHSLGVKHGIIENYPLKFKTVRRYENDVRVRIPNVSKAKKHLGWKPIIKTYESLEECVLKAKEKYNL